MLEVCIHYHNVRLVYYVKHALSAFMRRRVFRHSKVTVASNANIMLMKTGTYSEMASIRLLYIKERFLYSFNTLRAKAFP